jgi:hypothetical protein
MVLSSLRYVIACLPHDGSATLADEKAPQCAAMQYRVCEDQLMTIG